MNGTINSNSNKNFRYNFSDHILYDCLFNCFNLTLAIPIPEQIIIENKIGFPVEKAQHYLSSLLSLQVNLTQFTDLYTHLLSYNNSTPCVKCIRNLKSRVLTS